MALDRTSGFDMLVQVSETEINNQLAAAFLAAVGLAAFRLANLVAVALWALGLEGDFALTARFALFAGFAFERDVDRLNPFVRLLLMADLKRLLA